MKRAVEKEWKTLVVGTTPDYIDWLRQAAPGKGIFLTDPVMRQAAKEPDPEAGEEILSDLADYEQTGNRLRDHLEHWGLDLDGIACFDCESMELAALLAKQYALPYPSQSAIGLCRDKYLSKLKWQENGLGCPKVRKIGSPEEAEHFWAELQGPVVLKPLTGSGSEHVYLCRSTEECRTRYGQIASALQNKEFHRLYRSSASAQTPIVAEEYIAGDEYSCDFLIDKDQIGLIRMTKKIRATHRPFGTIQGYILDPPFPEEISERAFLEILRKSARSLHIERGICMIDLMLREKEIILLELAPRPGGDCLPYLLRKVYGFDILTFSLDFARQEYLPRTVPLHGTAPAFMGIRIIGEETGILKEIDIKVLAEDPRVLEIGLTKEPGHQVLLPPEDYDSWILGYIIARLDPERDPQNQLFELEGKLNVVMEQA